jgi:hypothetical protein
MTHPKKLKGV